MRNPNGCMDCGSCLKRAKNQNGQLSLTQGSEEDCPLRLIRKSGEEYTSKALAERIIKNKYILTTTGGGVTFSGGEPLAHLPFIKECVFELKGISIALQTSGFSNANVFEEALSVCDYVLYDLKIYREDLHIFYCGESNKSILNNYKILAHSGKQFATRIPLIPNITDTEENLTGIASFMQSCGVTYAEALPYNQFTGSKYSALLRNDIPKYDSNATANDDMIRELFSSYGIKIKIM